jgi:hypothetical protein
MYVCMYVCIHMHAYQYLVELKLLQTYQLKYEDDHFATSKAVYLFDPIWLRTYMGFFIVKSVKGNCGNSVSLYIGHKLNGVARKTKHSALKASVTVLII